MAAIELGRRIGRLSVPYAREINGPGDVADYLRMALGSRRQEAFMVLGLDARSRLQMARTVARVGRCTPQEVFRPLVEAGMHSAVLADNHPSGEAEPSEADNLADPPVRTRGRPARDPGPRSPRGHTGCHRSLVELGLVSVPGGSPRQGYAAERPRGELRSDMPPTGPPHRRP